MSATQTILAPKIATGDYSTLLRLRSIKFREVEQYYLHAGTVRQLTGWMLNISCIKSEIPAMLVVVIPELIKERIPFKIVKDANTADQLLAGSLGYTNTGKILTVYPENTDQAARLAHTLINVTKTFRGPSIPTDAHLGGVVYAYYGGLAPGNQTFTIPFQLPRGIHWPFAEIAPVNAPKSNIIHNAYLIRSVIKSDTKGRVLKTLWIKGLRFRSCVIKEGLHDVVMDDHGRDIQDRLRWQYTLQNELSGRVPLPKAYELFQENGNTYLSMELIKGTPLHTVVSDLHESRSWQYLEISRKQTLLQYLLQILKIIDTLHTAGYVHRDISPANFLLDGQGNLTMIDLELAYNYERNEPSPAFDSGINGFTCPERAFDKKPSFKEDIFSLGAVMVVFFTDIYPARGQTHQLTYLKENLRFLIGDDAPTNLILECLDPDPSARPSLQSIRETIQRYGSALAKKVNAVRTSSTAEVPAETVKQLIYDGLRALNTPVMTQANGLWHSNVIEGSRQIENDQNSITYYPGLHTGASGPLYLIASAKAGDFTLQKVLPIFNANYRNVAKSSISTGEQVAPGLYHGSAGLAMFLAEAMESDLISITPETKRLLTNCLYKRVMDVTLAEGVAGQGLAVLAAIDVLSKDTTHTLLGQYAEHLISSQLGNGAWTINGEQRTGFSYGVAGIVIFMLEYYHETKDERALTSISKALQWLLSQSRKRNGNKIWLISDKEKTVNPWLENGFTGVALCFIRAYEILKDPKYKSTAEEALSNHPYDLVSNNLSLAGGIAGLGEVYLEAAEVFQDNTWRDRASWIVQVLQHTSYVQSDGSRFWAVENRKSITADFMTGNSGVLHFLMRYHEPEKFGFPLLPK
jgi:serine/threonine protein kinase